MKVSVILPVRNGGRYLMPAIESMLAQKGVDVEIVVIDDGSTDGSFELVDSLAANDARIRLYPNRAKGLIAALNCGIELCSHDMIARMDADDISLPDRLARQAAFLQSAPSFVAVGGQGILIDEHDKEIGRLGVPLKHNAIVSYLHIGSPFIHPAVMFRRRAALELGGYRPSFVAAEDLDLWIRFSEHGKLANLPDAVLKYRVHEASVSTTSVKKAALTATYARYCWFIRRSGGQDPSSAENVPITDASIAAIGTRWLSELDLTLFYLANGRGLRELADGLRPRISEVLRDSRLPRETRWRALYCLLHGKSSILPELCHLALHAPLFLSSALWEVLAMRLQKASQTKEAESQ